MENLNLAICEDRKDEQEFLKKQILSCQIPVKITFFFDGESFLETFRKNAYDLIFMDIYMGKMNGIETVKMIRHTDPNVLIAITTNSIDYTLDAYRLDVIKYLEKPICREDIRKLLAAAKIHKTLIRPALEPSDKVLPVPPEQILFAEQNKHQILFHLTNGNIIQKKGKLDDLEPRLAGGGFFRCHKSFLVNLSLISGFDPDLRVFVMQGGKSVYIRRADIVKARTAWEDYLFNMTERRGGA